MEVVSVPTALLGASDATRRWGVLCADARIRWPGVTRLEAQAACSALAGRDPEEWAASLLRVELGVVVSDGAGPYLVDADGAVVLVLEGHAHILDRHIAMGQIGTTRTRIGLLGDLGVHGVWRWVARADVDVADRVAVLDQLAVADTDAALSRWRDDWGSAAAATHLP